jgi:hypothetical protein
MNILAQQVGMAGAILLVALYIVLKMRPWERQKKEDHYFVGKMDMCRYDNEAKQDLRDIRDGINKLVTLFERNGGYGQS